jgi:hypothetical protein
MIEILLQAEGALSVGLLDRAEDLYRQVAEADPRNSIAVVGLARVALERGDPPGALVLARRALAIDAENAAAVRMVQRLEEVLAFRGRETPGGSAVTGAPSAQGTSPVPEASEASPVPEASEASPAPKPSAAPAPDAPPAPPPPETSPEAPHRRSLVDRLLRRG